MHALGRVTVVSRLFATLLFAGLVIAQAPHTVHHFFEPDHAGDECPLAMAGERLPGLGAEGIGLDRSLMWEPAARPPGPARGPEFLAQGPLARAPPRLASSFASLSSPRS